MMKRRVLFSLAAIPLFFQKLAAQTRLDISQIRPNSLLVYEELTRNNLTLTLATSPSNSFIQLFINGLQTRPGRDFTISGNVITLNAAYSSLDAASTFDVYYYK